MGLEVMEGDLVINRVGAMDGAELSLEPDSEEEEEEEEEKEKEKKKEKIEM